MLMPQVDPLDQELLLREDPVLPNTEMSLSTASLWHFGQTTSPKLSPSRTSFSNLVPQS